MSKYFKSLKILLCSPKKKNAWIVLCIHLIYYTRKHSSSKPTACSWRSIIRGISVQGRGGGLCPHGLCPWGSLSRGSLSRGYLSRENLFPGGLCPGWGLCQEGRISVKRVIQRGSLSMDHSRQRPRIPNIDHLPSLWTDGPSCLSSSQGVLCVVWYCVIGTLWCKLCGVDCRVVVTNVPRVWYQWRIQDFVCANSQSGCANLLFCKMFLPKSSKLLEKWKNLDWEGRPWHTPFGSTNGYTALVVTHMARHPRLFCYFFAEDESSLFCEGYQKLCAGFQGQIQDFPYEEAPTLQGAPTFIRFCQMFPKTAWNWGNFGPGGHVQELPPSPVQPLKIVMDLGNPPKKTSKNWTKIACWCLSPSPEGWRPLLRRILDHHLQNHYIFFLYQGFWQM